LTYQAFYFPSRFTEHLWCLPFSKILYGRIIPAMKSERVDLQQHANKLAEEIKELTGSQAISSIL